MPERLRVLEHHIKRVKYWDSPNLSPKEAARKEVEMWNTPITSPLEIIYPETPAFINGVARIIEAYRNGEEVEILDDFNDDRSFDPMCKECKQCPNPIRDRQYRLPGFEDI